MHSPAKENAGEIKMSDLTKLIRKAFADSHHPGMDNIVWHNGSHDPDCSYVKEMFKGKHWSRLKPERVLKAKDLVAVLSDNGFHHYLPAFMLAVVEYSPGLMCTVDSIVSRLTLPREIDIDETIKNADELRLCRSWPELDFDVYYAAQRESLADRVKAFMNFTYLFNFAEARAVYYFLAYIDKAYADESQYIVDTPRKAIDRFWYLFADKKTGQPRVSAVRNKPGLKS